jgi:hypothetical protein
MSSVVVKVSPEGRKLRGKMILADRDYVIQKLLSDSPDGSLANSILPWASERGLFVLQIKKIPSFLPEIFAKLLVVVTYQILVAAFTWKGVAELLDNPLFCWGKSYNSMNDRTPPMFDNDETVDLSKPDGKFCEEIHRTDFVSVVGQKSLPTLLVSLIFLAL